MTSVLHPPGRLTADAWLAPILEPLLGVDGLAVLRAADHQSLWAGAVASGLVEESVLLDTVATRLHLALADLSTADVRATELVSARWARKFHIVPLGADDDALLVATANPCDVDCERALAFASGRPVRFALASPGAIAAALDALYGADEEVAPASSATHGPERMVDVQLLSSEPDGVEHGQIPPDDAALVSRLLDEILGEGITARASDIHIEPEEQGIAVRHRIDGVMRLVRRLPRALAPALSSRVKIVSRLDIADRMRPQDGRARVAVNGVAVDLRVSTLPASHGEKIVIRVLDTRAAVITLESMGFNEPELERIATLLQAREGIILVTGPTGSGKTTTLYAALRRLKQRGVNIVTVEDPIEYRLAGIVQVQVRERAGLTFASALRSIMRQDPDVLLIGEIRDRETAEIAIQASLTGHLVLSTLHTNDAASAVTRLMDIGVAPYKIATAVKGVLAQRLVRRVCARCRGNGSDSCAQCGGGGYHGRLAIVEVLLGSPEFERRVAAGDSAERIAEAARREGMGSLWDSGMAHVRAGNTTLEELRRVASPHAAEVDVRATERHTREAAPVDGDASMRYLQRRSSTVPTSRLAERRVAQVSIGTVDVYVVRPLASGWRVLVLQRALDTRCPTAWETVHGRLEAGEEPEDAAIREVAEESGLKASRLYSVTVQPFYLHKSHTVQLAVVFAAFVTEPATVTLGPEHQRFEWLSVDEALHRFQWPREREALREIVHLLGGGDAGPVEDVLRVR